MGSGKRLVGWVVAVAWLAPIALGGCGGASELIGESPEPTQPTGPTEPTEPTEPSPSPTPTGPVTLTWHAAPDANGSDTTGHIAQECGNASQGRYAIEVKQMPPDFEGQQAMLQTRLAAGDAGDLISVDQTMLADFVAAGHLAPLPAGDQARLRRTALKGPLAANSVNGRVVAFPMSANTQLLWYRKSFAKRAGLKLSRPVTWDDLIRAAEKARTTVQVQGRKYEGYIVWLNALIQGAGGDLLKPDSKAGRAAAGVVARFARSKAADRKLENATEIETQERFLTGDAGFLVNWSYIWQIRGEARWKADDLGWALYPRTVSGRPSRPPVAGTALAVPAASKHRSLALEAARCITSLGHQVDYAQAQGLLPSLAAAYNSPRVRKAFPMAGLLRESLDTGAPRPTIARYQEVSAALQKSAWPPGRVDPRSTTKAAQRAVDNALR